MRSICDSASASLWRTAAIASALVVAACGSEEPGAFTVTHVDPPAVPVSATTPAMVRGERFLNHVSASLSSDDTQVARTWLVQIGVPASASLTANRMDAQNLSVMLPAGLPVGIHDVRVTSPAGETRTLQNGLTVFDGNPPDAGADGSAGTGGTGGAGGAAGVDAGGTGGATGGAPSGGTGGAATGGAPAGGAGGTGGQCPPKTTPPGGSCPTACTGGCIGGLCAIDCDGQSTCKQLTVTCPPGFDCTVSCRGSSACREAVINCPPSYACNIECDGSSACRTAKFNCSNGSCAVDCAPGASVCQGSTLQCGSDSCAATCASSGDAPAVACGSACTCKQC